MHLEVELGRCLCIHSLSQVVDISLQVLLYQRQIIPEPVQFLVDDTTQRTHSFRMVYEEFKNATRSMFRSRNSLSIVEVVIIIGAAPYAPKELYRIPIAVCHTHLNESKDGCGENCEVLTKREQRQIFTSMVSRSVEGLFSDSRPSPTDKVFIFVRTRSGEPFREIEGVEEDPSFELPTADVLSKRNIRHLSINVKNPCLGEGSISAAEKGDCWLRLLPYFSHLT